jgi:hypothetical protein
MEAFLKFKHHMGHQFACIDKMERKDASPSH